MSYAFICAFLSSFLCMALAIAAPTTGNLKENDKLIVVLNDSVVNIVPAPGRQFQIISSDPSEVFTVTARDTEVEVRAPEKQERSSKKIPSRVDIYMPPSPLELHVFDGAVTVNRHKGDMVLHLQKGKMLAKETSGQATLHSQKGDIQVLSHQGKLIIDSYFASVSVKELLGDMELQNFAGESVLEKNKGFMMISSGQGITRVLQSQGSLSFEVGKGSLNSTQFQGRIDGQSQEGAININMLAESDVNVKSTNGRVTVQTAPGAGSYINVVSQEGDIYAPSYMRVNRDGGVRVLRGRMKGDIQKGSVVVRTQEGAVIIK